MRSTRSKFDLIYFCSHRGLWHLTSEAVECMYGHHMNIQPRLPSEVTNHTSIATCNSYLNAMGGIQVMATFSFHTLISWCCSLVGLRLWDTLSQISNITNDPVYAVLKTLDSRYYDPTLVLRAGSPLVLETIRDSLWSRHPSTNRSTTTVLSLDLRYTWSSSVWMSVSGTTANQTPID